MRFGAFDFRPTLWPTLVTLILLSILIGLGVWQLERATWKQGLVSAHEARISQPPVAVSSLLSSGDELQYRQVIARGHYDLTHQLLLDNRIHRGRAGYHVLTPLRLDDGSGTVLVNRGWVPLGASRAHLPVLDGPAGSVTLTAMVNLPPARAFRLDTVEEAHSGWPQVIQQIETGPLEQRLGHELLPLILLLDAADPNGYVRDWRPVYGVTPEKHTAYAMQWFTLAAVLALIYIGVNTQRQGASRTRSGT